jgi:hypothetical protein
VARATCNGELVTSSVGKLNTNMKTSESITKIAEALTKAQAAMKPALKDSRNPHFNSKYADLTSVWDAIRAPLTDNGLSVLQLVGTNEAEKTTLTTRVLHVSGEWIESTWAIPIGKQDPQGLGSALSYARRYALAAAVGVVQDDDDANAAMPAAKPTQTFQPKNFSLADAIDEIQASTTLEELQSKFSRLYREAKASKDSVEEITLITAKDQMKEKLEAAPVRKYELKTLAKPTVKTEIEGEWK